jgi:hypothetical protein
MRNLMIISPLGCDKGHRCPAIAAMNLFRDSQLLAASQHELSGRVRSGLREFRQAVAQIQSSLGCTLLKPVAC